MIVVKLSSFCEITPHNISHNFCLCFLSCKNNGPNCSLLKEIVWEKVDYFLPSLYNFDVFKLNERSSGTNSVLNFKMECSEWTLQKQKYIASFIAILNSSLPYNLFSLLYNAAIVYFYKFNLNKYVSVLRSYNFLFVVSLTVIWVAVWLRFIQVEINWHIKQIAYLHREYI